MINGILNNHLRIHNLIWIFLSSLFLLACSNYHLKQGEGYIQVGGGKIWYRVFGEGKGTPIMMLHGGPGGTSRSFYQFEEIGKDRPIIIFDQLYHALAPGETKAKNELLSEYKSYKLDFSWMPTAYIVKEKK